MIDEAGAIFLVLLGAVLFYMWKKSKENEEPIVEEPVAVEQPGSDKREEELRQLAVPNSFPRVTLVYGSKTNTAQGYAKQLHEEAQILGIDSTLKDCEDFTLEELKGDSLRIFLMATDGEGEPTDNAVPFHQLVKKNAKEGNKIMTGDYVVFGLGDSSYEHFNAMGHFFKDKLAALGGNFVFEYGETDA